MRILVTLLTLVSAQAVFAADWSLLDFEIDETTGERARFALTVSLESGINQPSLTLSIIRTDFIEPELGPEGALDELALSISHPTNPMRSNIILGGDQEAGKENLCGYSNWQISVDDQRFDVVSYREGSAIGTLLQISGPESPDDFWRALRSGTSIAVGMHEECGFRADPKDYEYTFSLDAAAAAMDYVLKDLEK